MSNDSKDKSFSFELKLWNRGVTDDELILDLQSIAQKLGKDSVKGDEYNQFGNFSLSTLEKRFGSWNAALERAGLRVAHQKGTTNEDLFENLEKIWIKLGRQPTAKEMASPLSEYSENTYLRHFGSWRNALIAFVHFINQQDEESLAVKAEQSLSIIQPKRRTNREPSLQLRFRVMRRDNFKCCYCGKSPATHPGIELHVDHIVAWSKGGETEIDNLQTLCSECNLGKSDLSETNYESP